MKEKLFFRTANGQWFCFSANRKDMEKMLKTVDKLFTLVGWMIGSDEEFQEFYNQDAKIVPSFN